LRIPAGKRAKPGSEREPPAGDERLRGPLPIADMGDGDPETRRRTTREISDALSFLTDGGER